MFSSKFFGASKKGNALLLACRAIDEARFAAGANPKAVARTQKAITARNMVT
jgi:hypothetical protein